MNPPAPGPDSQPAPTRSLGGRFRLGRRGWAWAFYDWANSAFTLSILTALFGPFFARYWASGNEDAFFWLGITVAASGLAVALLSPVLGVLAEGTGRKVRFVLGFAGLGAIATALLALPGEGDWLWAMLIRVAASVGFYGSLVFYDSLLTDVSTRENRHWVSAAGFALGYLGSVILLVGQTVVIENPSLIGLPDSASAVKLSFLSVAIWWILFSIPLAGLYRMPPGSGEPARPAARAAMPVEVVPASVRAGIGQRLAETLALAGHSRAILLFLIAYFLYIDGVNTVILMAAGYASEVGISLAQLNTAIVLVQLVGVPCALLFGLAGERFGPRGPMLLAIGTYSLVTLLAYRLEAANYSILGLAIPQIWVLGILIGIVQGGLQSLSRSYYAQLIPADRASAFFGLYNMLGRCSAFLGPLLMAAATAATGSVKASIWAILVLFAGGFLVLALIPGRQDRHARRAD